MSGSPRVIVVGSGPAAAMAARNLVDRGVRVLMLETGDAPTAGLIVRAAGNVIVRRLPNHHLSDKGRHKSPQGRSTEWWQSLTPGGRSNHWTAAVPRFAPRDFVDGDQLGPEMAWPIGYDDLAAYYDVAEDLLHVTAGSDDFEQLPSGRAAYRRSVPSDWDPVASSALAGGRGLTPMPMAIGKRWMVARRGTEFSSYHSIVRPLLERSNFELRLGAHVTEVLPSDGSSTGPGVRYRSRHGHSIESVRGDAVVLGAGALATTRLLLASRSSDAPSGVGNSRGVVGRYLHDHPRSWFPVTVSKPLTLPSHMLYLVRQPYDTAAPLTGAAMTISLAR